MEDAPIPADHYDQYGPEVYRNVDERFETEETEETSSSTRSLTSLSSSYSSYDYYDPTTYEDSYESDDDDENQAHDDDEADRGTSHMARCVTFAVARIRVKGLPLEIGEILHIFPSGTGR